VLTRYSAGRIVLHMADRVSYDLSKIREDMALRGWNARDLARIAGVSQSGVSKFLRNQAQTAKMATKLATALGFGVRRYLISARDRMSA